VCPGCLDPFEAENPAGQLPCLHPLCQRCIDKERSQPGECQFLIEGVYCHTPFTKERTISAFTVAQGSLAAATAAGEQQQQQQQQLPMCGSCEENAATHRCDTCGLLLCVAEAPGHPVAKASKGHVVVPLMSSSDSPTVSTASSSMSSSWVIPAHPCQAHMSTEAILFCDSCNQLICASCVGRHGGHVFFSVSQGMDKCTERIQALLPRVVAKRDALYKNGTAEIQGGMDHLQQLLDTEMQKITDAFEPVTLALRQTQRILDAVTAREAELRDEVSAREAELRDEVSAAIRADYKTLEDQLNSLIVFNHHVDSVQRAVEQQQQQQQQQQPQHDNHQRQRYSTAMRLLLAAHLDTLEKVVVSASPKVDTTKYFAYSKPAAIGQLLEALGDVRVDQLGRAVSKPLYSLPGRDYRQLGDTPKRSFGGKGSDLGRFSNPTGISVDPTGAHLLVAEHASKRVQLVTITGSPVRMISTNTEDGTGAYSAAVAPTGDVWVACNGDRLFAYNQHTGLQTRSIIVRSLYVATETSGAILVGCGSQSKATLFNADGSLRWSSTGAGFDNAWGVAFVPDEQLVAVSDNKNHRVQVLSLADGHHVLTIGGKSSDMINPMALSYDAALRVLVVGEGNKISAWTMDGKLVHRWGKDIDCSGVLVHPEDGAIYASAWNHNKVLVF